MKITIPYLKWRDGRPRWEPGPKLRAEGWKGRDLKTERGPWMAFEEACDTARRLNAEVEARRAAGEKAPRRGADHKRQRTVRHLHDLWIATPEHELLREATRNDYRRKASALLAEIGDVPVAALEFADLKGLWRHLYRERGHHMANGVMAVARAMLSHARELGWIATNPAFDLALKTPAPRQVLWLPAELEALVAAADAIGRPSIGHAILIALHTGQRQGDVLAMPARLFDESRIKLSQLKTHARIDAPMTPQLMERVRRIFETRAVVSLDLPLVLTDATGQPYKGDYFRHCFEEVRAAASQRLKGEASAALLSKRFQDLRDTAVTRLALAGCTLPQIAAITGHAPDTVTKIIKHYLVMQPEMADAAIAKLSTWLEKEGIAI